MITDFIKVYDDAVSEEYCQKFIQYIEHYVENGIILKEPFEPDHKDHHTVNFHNDAKYDMLAGDQLPLTFLPMIKEYVDDYLPTYSLLSKEILLMFDVKAKKFLLVGVFIAGTMKIHHYRHLLEN
mgnify:CR=1 FL=1